MMMQFSLERLPAEILLMTIQLADRKTLLALCLTSRKLVSLAQPQLYQDLNLELTGVFSSPAIIFWQETLLLYRSLSTNEVLRKHVRQLRIRVGRPPTPEMIESSKALDGNTMLFELISWLSAVRSLTISVPQVSKIDFPWKFMVYIMREMKYLEELGLSFNFKIETSALLLLLEPTRLKSLHLACDGRALGYVTESSHYSIKSNPGSKNLLRLHFRGNPAWLKEVLPACENLQELFISVPELGCDVSVQDLLFPIKHTLSRLDLCLIPYVGSRPVSRVARLHRMQVSDLASLTDLAIHGWVFESENTPFDIQGAFLLDSLRSLSWYHGAWTAKSVQTLREAFQLASCSNLKTFRVEISAMSFDKSELQGISREMKRLSLELSDRGIAVECSTCILE